MMIFEKIKAILSESMGVEDVEITPDTNLAEDLWFDELDFVDLAMDLEDTFSTEITDEVLEKFTTVGDIVEYLEKL